MNEKITDETKKSYLIVYSEKKTENKETFCRANQFGHFLWLCDSYMKQWPSLTDTTSDVQM